MTFSSKELELLTSQKMFYKGVIEDNNDPMQIGRVRVRVLGIHSDSRDDVPTNTLPWSPVLKSLDFGGFQSGMGISSVPTKGTWVLCVSDSGSTDNFIVLGGISGVTKTKSSSGFSDPSGAYPKSSYLGKSDYNSLAVGGNYISNNVIETPSGHRIEMNDGGYIKIYHVNGCEIIMDGVGIAITSINQTNMTCVNDFTNNILGTSNHNTSGSTNITSGNSANVSAATTISLNAVGDISISSGGSINITSEGGPITLKSPSNTMVI